MWPWCGLFTPDNVFICFWRFHLWFKKHKCGVQLWRSSCKTKHVFLKLVFITELIFSENSESNSKSHEPTDVGTSVVLTARLATKICQFFITLFTNTEGAGLTTYSSQTLRCLGFTLEEQSCCQTLCHWFQHDNIESYRNGFPSLLLKKSTGPHRTPTLTQSNIFGTDFRPYNPTSAADVTNALEA